MKDLLINTNTEEYRHECEIRWLSKKNLKDRRYYLLLVEEKRGLQAKLKLMEGLQELWNQKKKR